MPAPWLGMWYHQRPAPLAGDEVLHSPGPPGWGCGTTNPSPLAGDEVLLPQPGGWKVNNSVKSVVKMCDTPRPKLGGDTASCSQLTRTDELSSSIGEGTDTLQVGDAQSRSLSVAALTSTPMHEPGRASPSGTAAPQPSMHLSRGSINSMQHASAVVSAHP